MNLHLCWPRVAQQALRVQSIGNSWKYAHLAEAFSTQWSDAVLAARDAKAKKSEALVATVDNFGLCGHSEAASRIEHAISWNDAGQQIEAHEDDDDEHIEGNDDWCTGDCDDVLDETTFTVGTPTDDPELLEQFDCNLEDADASASQVCASTSRSFQEARELLFRVESARGCFPVVGIGASDGLAPSTDRTACKVTWQRREGQEEREILFAERWKVAKHWFTWHLAKTTDLTFRVSSSDVQGASDGTCER